MSSNEVNFNFTQWFIHFGSQRETFARVRPLHPEKVLLRLITKIKFVNGDAWAFLAFPHHAKQIHSAYIKMSLEGASVVVVVTAENLISNAAAASHALITALISPRRRKNYLSSEPNIHCAPRTSNNNKNKRVQYIYIFLFF